MQGRPSCHQRVCVHFGWTKLWDIVSSMANYRWTMAMILCFQPVWVFTLAVLDGAAAIVGCSQSPGCPKHETVVGFRIISG